MVQMWIELRRAVGLACYYARKQYGPGGVTVLAILWLTFLLSIAIVACCR